MKTLKGGGVVEALKRPRWKKVRGLVGILRCLKRLRGWGLTGFLRFLKKAARGVSRPSPSPSLILTITSCVWMISKPHGRRPRWRLTTCIANATHSFWSLSWIFKGTKFLTFTSSSLWLTTPWVHKSPRDSFGFAEFISALSLLSLRGSCPSHGSSRRCPGSSRLVHFHFRLWGATWEGSWDFFFKIVLFYFGGVGSSYSSLLACRTKAIVWKLKQLGGLGFFEISQEGREEGAV